VPGAIGYVELNYARQNKLPAALVVNAAGKAVAPSITSVTSAAAGATSKLSPATDFRLSIVNAPGAESYPISGFTYILIYKDQQNPVKGAKLMDFLKWAVHDGSALAPALDYAPLPASIVALLDKRFVSAKTAKTASIK
jgi:phosphate transport system substrate-binding protein